MGIRVGLYHRTTYRYDRDVGLSPQIVRLRPAPHSRTAIEAYSLRVSPRPHFLNWQQDPHSNWLARVVFPSRVRELTFEVDLVADLVVINPFDFFLEPSAETVPFAYEDWLARELAPFLEKLEAGPRMAELVASVDRRARDTTPFLVELNCRLAREIRYLVRMEPGVQSCEETLALGSGSCRDSAFLLVQLLRHLGLASRFVSGYLIQLQPDQPPLAGPAGPTADFCDLHAWAEVYLPGAGWVGLDPTSGLLAGEGHIPLAATPDPSSAAPITGRVEPCEVEFSFDMSLRRIREVPRVTLPYGESEWSEIDALGRRVDDALVAGDVRLTMGGEPTFVALDAPDAPEWNTEANGAEKRRRAEALVRRLGERFATGGLLHFGQGKWYPGESLPRWALTCYWRRDGAPIWHDAGLLRDASESRAATVEDAERFARRLARALGLDPERSAPAFENPLHYLRAEGSLPPNVDPLDSKLEDPEERARLRSVFLRGLGRPVGWVLPLQRVPGASGPLWQTGLWMLRAGPILLVPGDSPLGLRLPLASLPWLAPGQGTTIVPQDPLAERGPLPPPRAFERGEARSTPDGGAPDDPTVRTALCVEPREGRLHAFMPPLATLEDYLDLTSAVEETAASLAQPVVVEGYPPPWDPRVNLLRVTPDPGVIEVNVQPAASWPELVDLTTGLYEEARAVGLGTEKFQFDGRHSGTGGGNHVVVGGPTPADSPFLRRPDLLRSLLGYWLNHPSLSYLFSGLFVGPTSQAPRVDEARLESVYELEIAFRQIPEPGQGHVPPWLVDRIFRHLLTDVTGNTHRAEFCIDKLYAPESASGRLGLLELRAFEMPPHARMSLTQQLLLRALIAAFWQSPYREAPVRWGSRLHDRFLLPHFVWEDFRFVLGDLERRGWSFRPEWFAPHFEFRFPQLGRVERQGIALELRQAIEPWNVLGEEPAAGGPVRFVDSSVERLQVQVHGWVGERHALACNGRRVPLHPTGTQGQLVAGVRYRAWQPPSALHPTIPVHTPLVFDVIDRWAARSIGGCTYHVAHPGGRNYETRPVNANEAEARRVARFFPIGHTPGVLAVPVEERDPDSPLTLDLRRFPDAGPASAGRID